MFLGFTPSFLAPHFNLSASGSVMSKHHCVMFLHIHNTLFLFFLTVRIGQMLYLIWHITVKLPPFRAPQNWSLAIAFHPSRLSFLSCHQPSLSLRRSLAFALLLCKQHGWDMMFTTGSRAGSGLQAQCDGSTNNP